MSENTISEAEYARHIALQAALFKEMVAQAAIGRDWKIINVSDRSAEIQISVGWEKYKTCFLCHLYGTVTFYAPTQLTYDSLDEVPHRLSTQLLSANDTMSRGYWCLEELNDKHTFTCVHAEELTAMELKNFVGIISTLVENSAAIDRAVLGDD